VTHLHQAMVDARTDVLEDLLDPGYTLTHLAGEVQPREAWFVAIRSRAFEYHHIREGEAKTSIKGHTGKDLTGPIADHRAATRHRGWVTFPLAAGVHHAVH